MAIFPLAPDQTIAQMWSNGARGGDTTAHGLDRELWGTYCTLAGFTDTSMSPGSREHVNTSLHVSQWQPFTIITGSVYELRVCVTLKYEQFLCTVPLFVTKTAKMHAKKFDVNNYIDINITLFTIQCNPC